MIINCSPSSYNEAETLSTLRFGMRAKSIKNTARINAELSPAELKGLLKKAQAANTSHQAYIAALEAELQIWRSDGHVDSADWASQERASIPGFAPKRSPNPSTPVRSATPFNPTVDVLRGDFESRPQTPTVIGLDKDERDEFLKRENELSDQLAERESTITALEKQIKELREELAFVKEQESVASQVCIIHCHVYTPKTRYRKTRRCQVNSTRCVCKWNVLTTRTRMVS